MRKRLLGACVLIGMLTGTLIWHIANRAGEPREVRFDVSGQYRYVLDGRGNATINLYVGDSADEMSIPNELDGHTVTGIDKMAFVDYAFVHIVIPASVTNIEANPFYCFPSEDGNTLLSFAVAHDNPRYGQIEGVLYDIQEKTLVAYPTGRKGAYMIPEGIERIGDPRFMVVVT